MHKRPYLIFQSSQPDEEMLSLETASFKRKIRKPLKFENQWFQNQSLQTSKNPVATSFPLFEFQNSNNEPAFRVVGQRLYSTKSQAIEMSSGLLAETENQLI